MNHLPPEKEEELLYRVNEAGGVLSPERVTAVINPDEWRAARNEIANVSVSEGIMRVYNFNHICHAEYARCFAWSELTRFDRPYEMRKDIGCF